MQRFLYLLIILFLGACATVTQPKVYRETSYPSISYETAFNYVIRAGDDIGFEPAGSPKRNKEKGIVILVPKAETGERLAKAFFFTIYWTDFQLKVRINREGNIARGVHLKVTQAGGATVKREEMEKLAKTYLEALGKYWK